MRSTTRLIMIAWSAGMLAGCGSNGGGDQGDAAASPEADKVAAASVDPCGLITADEVSAAINDKVTAATADGDTCTYAMGESMSSLKIQYFRGDAVEEMKNDRRAARALGSLGAEAERSGGAAGADVNAMISEKGDQPAIGDEALYGSGARLSFRKGDAYVAIEPPLAHNALNWEGNPMYSSEEQRKIALDLAAKALARLP